MDRLAAQLDPLSAVLVLAGRGVAELVRMVVDVVAGLLSPGFILVGGIVGVLAAYLVYYLLWITLAGRAFWYVTLPGVASAVACLLVLKACLKCLRASLFEAAYTAPGTQEPARQPAPARPGRGRGRRSGAVQIQPRVSARRWPQPRPRAREAGRKRREPHRCRGCHHGGWVLTRSHACCTPGGW